MSTKLVTKKVRGVLVLMGYKGEQPRGDVVIPEGVVRIHKEVFQGCDELTSVALPSSLVKMGENVFRGCNNLLAIHVDAANTVFSSKNGLLLNKRGSTLLMVPYGVSSVMLPSSVTEFEDDVFDSCKNLAAIQVEEGNLAYSSKDGLLFNKAGTTLIAVPYEVTSVTLSAAVKEVSGDAFVGREKITAIQVEKENSTYSSMGGLLFNKNRSELIAVPEGVTTVTLPKGVKEIRYNQFADCNALTSVTLSKGVKTIDDHAFINCRNLTSIVIPEGVSEIGARAFWNCQSLTSVVIPASVRTIKNSSFLGCKSLTSVTILAPKVTFGKKVFKGCSNVNTVQLPNGVQWEDLIGDGESDEGKLITVEEFFWRDYDELLLAGEIY